MKLYLIHDLNDDGDNFDLLVWATDRKGAVSLWFRYYELDEDEPEPDQVLVVPHTPPSEPAAIAWEEIRPS